MQTTVALVRAGNQEQTLIPTTFGVVQFAAADGTLMDGHCRPRCLEGHTVESVSRRHWPLSSDKFAAGTLIELAAESQPFCGNKDQVRAFRNQSAIRLGVPYVFELNVNGKLDDAGYPKAGRLDGEIPHLKRLTVMLNAIWILARNSLVSVKNQELLIKSELDLK